MLELTDSNFENETNTGLVLVDFWADWCAPCKMFLPVLEKLAAKYDGKVKFTKVNAADQSRFTALYNISSLPTVVIFRNGEVVNKYVGVQPERKLTEVLDGILGEIK